MPFRWSATLCLPRMPPACLGTVRGLNDVADVARSQRESSPGLRKAPLWPLQRKPAPRDDGEVVERLDIEHTGKFREQQAADSWLSKVSPKVPVVAEITGSRRHRRIAL
jgi:hypothetical protein